MAQTALSPEQNPVLRSEFAYQRFVIERSRSGWLWIGLAILLVAPALLIALGYTGLALIGWIVQASPVELFNTPHLTLGIVLAVANFSLYPVVTLVTLALSRGSIAREKTRHTWDLLRLTKLHPRQILLGKWWASLKALNGDHIMVLILRVGLIAFWMTVILPTAHRLHDMTAPYRLYFLMLVLPFIAQALADSALTAMLGVVSAVPDGVLQTTAEFSASVVRLMTVVAVMIWTWQIFITLEHRPVDATILALGGMVVTVLLVLGTLWIGQRLVRHQV